MNFRRILFYILSFTWGIVMSTIGLLVILFSLFFKRVRVYHGRLYAVWGKGWGGMALGCFFVCSTSCGEDTFAHECGHGLQNCIWGPLFPFIIGVPSMIRYWYREIKSRKERHIKLPPYDSIWFEGQATRWGEKYVATDLI